MAHIYLGGTSNARGREMNKLGTRYHVYLIGKSIRRAIIVKSAEILSAFDKKDEFPKTKPLKSKTMIYSIDSSDLLRMTFMIINNVQSFQVVYTRSFNGKWSKFLHSI